jgi:hypothetical protein
LAKGIAHPFARHVRGFLVKESLGSRLARSVRLNTRRHRGAPPIDASGRRLQSTFQRRALEHRVASSTEAPENRANSRRPIHFARQPLKSATIDDRRRIQERRSSGVRVAKNQVQAPQPLGQGRIHPQPVKVEDFRGPERLPPTSSPPQALPRTTRVRVIRFSTSFHFPAGTPPGARPPSPTPAATAVASLDPMPLADFCNQQRSPSTPFERPDLAGGPPSRSLRASGGDPPLAASSADSEPRFQIAPLREHPRWPRTIEPACTQRCRGQLEGTWALPGHHPPRHGPGKAELCRVA